MYPIPIHCTQFSKQLSSVCLELVNSCCVESVEVQPDDTDLVIYVKKEGISVFYLPRS